MKKHASLITPLLIGISAFLFWAFPYRAALNYHEEHQFFLIDDDYLLAHLQSAGGISVYLSEALVQFYYNRWLGAAILAVEFVLIYLLSAGIVKKLPAFKGSFLLPLIPVVVLWLLLGDFDVMHSLLMAVLLALLLLYIVMSISKAWSIRLVGLFVALPLFWWMCWTSHYRFPKSFASFDTLFDSKQYEGLEYDLLVRQSRWDEIVQKAEKSKPTTSQTLCATNLALGMTNKLLTHGKQFNRYGVIGLLPPFEHNQFLALTLAETYYQLGMVNSAQRLFFESMEGIRNRNKSARCIQRLAETNLINGQYQVATKYLKMLGKTVFYRRWARERMKLIYSGDTAVNADKHYGRMRKMCLDQDFLYNDIEMIDRVFATLFAHNTGNNMAMQYALCYAAIEGNAEKYQAYSNLFKKYRPDALIPQIAAPTPGSHRPQN